MKPETSARPILIVSNDADETRTLRNLLERDGSPLLGADNEVEGIRNFQQHRPVMLVLAFSELTKAERFYLMLYRQCPTIRETPHQTLLLCKANESEAAFSLCRNGTFDDYLINRPMHDPLRLRLAVHQALLRQSGHGQTMALNQQLSHIGSDFAHLNAFIDKTMAGGKALQGDAIQTLRQFSSRLSQELDQFEAQMKAVVAGERAGLSQQLDRLRRDCIEPDTRQLAGTLEKSALWIQQFDDGYQEQTARIKSQTFPPAEPEVMLVDDDEIYREMLSTLLEEVQMRVTQADSGEEALSKMRQRTPDLVLLDFNMPGLDGLAVLQQMKSDPTLHPVPVVMLTGVHARETVRDVIQAGAAGFIVKPSNRPTILAKIQSVLQQPRTE
ncbi:MAG: response regulator [Rhodocyclaceae bacterium]|jgi:CheY-like chemotaxis protein|nr:response regulator [Rhodocyclaceae bacterium]